MPPLAARGFELMENVDLTASVPTAGVMAAKVGWKYFPSPELLARLTEKTHGRIIRSDEPWAGSQASARKSRAGDRGLNRR